MQNEDYNIKHVFVISSFYSVPDRVIKIIVNLSMLIGKNVPKKFLIKIKKTPTYKSLIKLFGFYRKIDQEVFEQKLEHLKYDPIEQCRYFTSIFKEKEKYHFPKENIQYQIINIRGEHDVLSRETDFLKIAHHYGEKAFSIIIPHSGHAVLMEKPEIMQKIFEHFENIPSPKTKSNSLIQSFLKFFRF